MDDSRPNTWSDATWDVIDPSTVGMNSKALAATVEFHRNEEADVDRSLSKGLQSVAGNVEPKQWAGLLGPTKPRGDPNGLVLRHGKLAASWGDTERADMTFSATKSYLAVLTGFAVEKGLIKDIDEPMRNYALDDGFESTQNRDITWRHLLQQASEWEGTLWDKPDQADRRMGIDRELQTPGTFWEYNDVRVNLMAYSLLHLFKRPLPEVLEERIMDRIGASDDWRWHGYETSWTEIDGQRMQSVSGGGHWGGGFIIDTRDHARFGLLALRGGRWGGEQLVSSEWFDMATRPADIQSNYGYMWWLNTDQAQLPSAPGSVFYANGAGSTNIIYIDRDNDLVTVTRWVDGAEHVDEFIRLVLESIEGEG